MQHMDAEVDQLFLLEDALLQEKSGSFTGDGSVDFQGQPVQKSKSGTWQAFPYIFVNDFCERLAFHGIDKNLVNYLTSKLNQGNVSAARTVTTWSGTCYLAPLIGAFLADAYLGKYRTIAIFSSISFIGMCTLTVSASVPAVEPSECEGSVCPAASPAQYAVFFVGLYLVALGIGGIKPCVSSFGADQFDDTDPHERVGKGSYFNWFYFSISFGSLVSSTLMIWIQENVGWGLGFGISALSMAISIAVFFSGTPLFRFQKPGGSPLTRICQVLVASLWKHKLDIPEDSTLLFESSEKVSAIQGSRKLQHTEEFKFLDKAAVLSDAEINGGNFSDYWRLCTVTQVEELKILIRMFPILATSVVFSAVYAQMSTTFVEQGMVMDRTLGPFIIPAACLSTFDVLTIILGVPIYDRVIIPIASKFTANERGFTNLQRMGIGFVISIFTMVAAAVVEIKRLQMAATTGFVNEKVPIPMSILWQIPQYVLIGAAETFFYIGRMEFFYEESPDAIRSLCTAFSLLTSSLGGYLNSLSLTIVSAVTTAEGKPGWIPDNLNEGKLYNYFWLWAIVTFFNSLLFVHCAMRYKQRKAS